MIDVHLPMKFCDLLWWFALLGIIPLVLCGWLFESQRQDWWGFAICCVIYLVSLPLFTDRD